ncbi:MAG: DUF1446 domain-containing protein [Planctomycetota bacterium]|nr:DUF1446 domain-containing protein [Planctomycetota bacterium]
MKRIRVGNAAGFWGDNLDAPRRLAERGELDFLTLEYLAELTLSILAGQRRKNPELGYVPDTVSSLVSLASALKSQSQLHVVTNGGGMNPTGCAQAAGKALAEAGLADLKIAAVAGDNLLPRLAELFAGGETFAHFDTDAPLGDLRNQVASANVYLGAEGIVAALAQGARVVLTGRVADASLTVGPAIHALGWSPTDWNRLAAATVAGHLIECGAQVTGGMFSGWTPDLVLRDLGYPIAEIADSGEVWITKPTGTGGRVDEATVAEQLVYEIGDPAHYLTPDVDANFSQVTLTTVGPDRVAVANATGGPPPATLKVSMTYPAGFRATGTLVVCGQNAVLKARSSGELIRSRLAEAGEVPQRLDVEILGSGDALGGVLPRADDAREVVLRVSAADPSRERLERFVREFSPLVGSGPPGVTGYTGPRPAPFPLFAYWPTRIARKRVEPVVEIRTAREWAGR